MSLYKNHGYEVKKTGPLLKGCPKIMPLFWITRPFNHESLAICRYFKADRCVEYVHQMAFIDDDPDIVHCINFIRRAGQIKA